MIELGKKYQTSDGRKIRILAIDTDPSDTFPVIGFCYSPRANGSEYLQRWSRHGAALYKEEDDTCDLVPVPTKHEGWVAMQVTPNGIVVIADGALFGSKKDAQFYIDSTYACGSLPVYVTWED